MDLRLFGSFASSHQGQAGGGEPLGNIIEPSGEKFRPSDEEDTEFSILGVSNSIGIYLNEVKTGSEINQSYIRVSAGDLVYNPHRVNVGSIGFVPEELGGGIVPGIYVVFRPKSSCGIPSEYLYHLLRTSPYLEIIRAYDTRHGAVRANLKLEQLKRIKMAMPSEAAIEVFNTRQNEIRKMRSQADDLESQLTAMIGKAEYE